MPRLPTFPDCIDEVEQISIADLKRFGLLRPKGLEMQKEVVSTGYYREMRMRISVNLISKLVMLEFAVGDNKSTQLIRLESRPSNLGKGQVWYFVCPVSNRLCRKLYMLEDQFLSRFAYPGVMYSSQIEKKTFRGLRSALELAEKRKQAIETLKRKYAKPFYRGKPTTSFRRLLGRQDQLLLRFERLNIGQ